MNPINLENAEHYTWGISSDGWHLLKSDGLSVIEEVVPPNEGEQRHYHNEAQQFFYILEGVAHIEVSGRVHQLLPNSGIHIPAKMPHQLMNKGSAKLRFLVISSPMSHGDRVNI